jgi:hypothetical protein
MKYILLWACWALICMGMNKHNHISYARYAIQHNAAFLKFSGKLLRVEMETHQGCPYFHDVPYCFHTAQRSNHILLSMNQLLDKR